jgi:mono/diheme cytochrome c family protein
MSGARDWLTLSWMARRHIILFASLWFLALAALAADSPRGVWIKAKCALCHGIDGSGQTDAGRQTKAPDLRADAIQKLTDEALAKSISGGHERMPAFRKQVSAEKVRLLLAYIRGLRPR